MEIAAPDNIRPVDITDESQQSSVQRRKKCNDGKEKQNKARLYTFTKSF